MTRVTSPSYPARVASAAKKRQTRAERAARIAADPSLARHGRAGTYKDWGCRCAPCTAAATAARMGPRPPLRELIDERFGRPSPGLLHEAVVKPSPPPPAAVPLEVADAAAQPLTPALVAQHRQQLLDALKPRKRNRPGSASHGAGPMPSPISVPPDEPGRACV